MLLLGFAIVAAGLGCVSLPFWHSQFPAYLIYRPALVIETGGWDTHSNNFEKVAYAAGVTGVLVFVVGLAVSQGGKTVLTACEDNLARLWSIERGKELCRFQGHTGQVWVLAYSPDGRTLATGSEDETVKLWDAAAGKELATLKGHSGKVVSLTCDTAFYYNLEVKRTPIG